MPRPSTRLLQVAGVLGVAGNAPRPPATFRLGMCASLCSFVSAIPKHGTVPDGSSVAERLVRVTDVTE